MTDEYGNYDDYGVHYLKKEKKKESGRVVGHHTTFFYENLYRFKLSINK